MKRTHPVTHTGEVCLASDPAPDAAAERRKRRWQAALLVAAAALALGGCVVDDENADATDATTTTPDATSPSDAANDTGTPPTPYRFVRVTDQSELSMTVDGGADIDAVILDKAGGDTFYAQSVEGFAHGGGLGEQLDPSDALFAPDAFYAYPDDSVCDVDSGFVSLGGIGGFLIVGMDADIEAGDQLTVMEVGGCSFDGGEAIAEEVTVEVSISKESDAQWVFVGTGEGPTVSFAVPPLE